MTTDYALVIDLEVDLGGDRKDPSPYNKDNTFVALGYTLRSPHGYLLGSELVTKYFDNEVVILNIEDSNITEQVKTLLLNNITASLPETTTINDVNFINYK